MTGGGKQSVDGGGLGRVELPVVFSLTSLSLSLSSGFCICVCVGDGDEMAADGGVGDRGCGGDGFGDEVED